MFHIGSYFNHSAGTLMAQHHGSTHDEITNATSFLSSEKAWRSENPAWISNKPSSAHRCHRFRRFAFRARPLHRYDRFLSASPSPLVDSITSILWFTDWKRFLQVRRGEIKLHSIGMEKILPDGDRRFYEALKQYFLRVEEPCRCVMKGCLSLGFDI
jgi:hypothetical protein